MTGKFFLTAFAAVAAVAVIASPQDPSFEFPAAKHVGFNVQKAGTAVDGLSSDQLSASFKNATWREVLDWLKDHGVNFVVGDNEINKDQHVNVSVTNVSVEALMGALASALDGHWDKRNDIWVFRKGSSWIAAPVGTVSTGKGDTFFAPTAAGKAEIATAQKSMPTWITGGNGDGFAVAQKGSDRFFPALTAPMTKEQQELFKKAMGKMDDPKAWAEFQKSWEKWAKDYEKNYKEFEKNFKAYGYDGKTFKDMTDGSTVFVTPGQSTRVDQKRLEDLMKRSAELSKDAQKRVLVGSGKDGDFKFDQKAIEDMQKRAIEMSKDSKLFLQPGQNGVLVKGLSTKGLTAKQLKELRGQTLDMAKAFRVVDGKTLFVGANGTNGASLRNMKAIYDLLTPAQEQKIKRSGYLNYSDLNSKQRSLLGVMNGESWSISYHTDKWGLMIKSDR